LDLKKEAIVTWTQCVHLKIFLLREFMNE